MTRSGAIGLVAALALATTATAATVGGSGVSGLRTHDHSSTSAGGTTLAPVAPTSGNAALVSLTANGQTRPSLALRGTRTGSTNYAVIYGGATNDGTNNIASSTTAAAIVVGEPATGDILFYANTGLTEGGAFSFSERARIKADGTISTSKACASGYTRVGPNYCARSTGYSGTALTRDACTSVALPASDAKALIIGVQGTIVGSSAAGVLRYARVTGYSESLCSGGGLSEVRDGVIEFNAVSATIGVVSADMLLATTTPYIKFDDDAGNGGSASYFIRGYLD